MFVRPARLVREILLAENLCQSLDNASWRCLTVKVPDGVGVGDDIVAVIEREDIETGRYISDSNYRLDPHVQIVVRGVGFSRTYDKIREIADFLDTLYEYSVSVDGDEYLTKSLKRTTNIQYNGADATGKRYVYTIEYDVLLN